MLDGASFKTKVRKKTGSCLGTNICILGDQLHSLAIAGMLADRGANVNVVKASKRSKMADEKKPFNFRNARRKARASMPEASNHRHSVAALKEKVSESASDLAQAEFVILSGEIADYSGYLTLLRKHGRDGQSLVLLNAPIGAALQFGNMLRKSSIERKFNIVEIGSIFDNVQLEADELVVTSVKCRAGIAGKTRNQLRNCMHLDAYLPAELIPASNVLERGFCETERLLRPALLSFALLGGRGGSAAMKARLGTSSIRSLAVINVLEKLEREICCLASAFKSVPPSLLIALEEGRLGRVQTKGKLLLTAMMRRIRFDNTIFIKALSRYYEELTERINSTENPAQTALGIIKKDVLENCTIVAAFARLAHLQTPILDSVIDLAAGITDTDLRQQGRTLNDLGLNGYNLNEIIEYVNA
jgi:hypothetical protein